MLGYAGSRRYWVRSAGGESFWTSMKTDAGEGKALAAKKLMARRIPDIEAFVAGPPVIPAYILVVLLARRMAD